MFNFLKKHKPLESDEEPKLSVKVRALKAFSNIEGLDDIKEMMLRALESLERAHTLLIGPPASAKSLFMLEIEKLMPPNKVYFIEGGSTTKAGIQKFIAENPQKEIIIIDEIDKMLLKDQEGLLTMMLIPYTKWYYLYAIIVVHWASFHHIIIKISLRSLC